MELKPCPFCGGEIERKMYAGTARCVDILELRCPSCGYDLRLDTVFRVEIMNDPIDVIEIWNRRADDA